VLLLGEDAVRYPCHRCQLKIGDNWKGIKAGGALSSGTSFEDALSACAAGATTVNGLSNGTEYCVYRVLVANASYTGINFGSLAEQEIYSWVIDMTALTASSKSYTFGYNQTVPTQKKGTIILHLHSDQDINGYHPIDPAQPLADGQRFGNNLRFWTVSNTAGADGVKISAVSGKRQVVLEMPEGITNAFYTKFTLNP
jgi:hypothetical protein